MKISLAWSLLVLAASCVRVQADIPPICKTVSLEFAGPPAGSPPATQVQAEQTFPFGDGLKSSYLAQLQFAGGSVAAGSGTADLSFLDSLGVSVAVPAGSSLGEVPLLAWQKAPSGTVARIDMPAQPANLTPYFGATGLSLRVSMTGTPPPAGFSLIVDLCAN